MMWLDDKDIVVCASKYFSVAQMRQIHQMGIHHFGENRVTDLLTKKQALNDLDITFHFIGHLQRNKTKSMINDISYLHSLDSILLAEEIQKYRNEPLDCFIQVNITEETQKNGVLAKDLNQFLIELKKYDKIRVIGLMTIGKDEDMDATKNAFSTLEKLRVEHNLSYLSIGMSSDYLLALPYHPRFIRIGSLFKGVI